MYIYTDRHVYIYIMMNQGSLPAMAGEERSVNLAFRSFLLMNTNPHGQDLHATGIYKDTNDAQAEVCVTLSSYIHSTSIYTS